MKARYSIFSLARNARSYHENWTEAWRSPTPRPAYDVVIIGGGGHGLATAYYLAKEHGITNVAVIEKGWLGGGNTGRNTTVVRSNYLWDESAHLYEHSLKLWEGLSQDLNFNVMFSQRGLLSLGHDQHEMREISRRVNANRLNGIDSEILSAEQVKEFCPVLDCRPNARHPVLGASLQRRGGVARHDAVAWGYARGADSRGVDIIQNCEVTGFRIEQGRVLGVETTKGFIGAKKVGCVAAGHSSVLAAMAGLRLPIESHPLQALVSEPIKPVLHTVVMSSAVHVYVSQSDKGELVMGAGIDGYLSYAQTGSPPVVENLLNALVELFPVFSRLRVLRTWGGIVDVCPDASPIVSKTPIEGLYFNCGWGTGGFKATPGSGWVFAHTLAQDRPHKLNEPFALDRFVNGYLIDEHGAAGVAH
jgi:sarcosine oxidase subunit beta